MLSKVAVFLTFVSTKDVKVSGSNSQPVLGPCAQSKQSAQPYNPKSAQRRTLCVIVTSLSAVRCVSHCSKAQCARTSYLCLCVGCQHLSDDALCIHVVAVLPTKHQAHGIVRASVVVEIRPIQSLSHQQQVVPGGRDAEVGGSKDVTTVVQECAGRPDRHPSYRPIPQHLAAVEPATPTQ